MTTRRNLIIPGRVMYDTKIVIYMDSMSGATELKIEQGRLQPIQALGILMEHAVNLLRNMVSTRTAPLGEPMTAGNGADPKINDVYEFENKTEANKSYGKIGQTNDGGNDNAS